MILSACIRSKHGKVYTGEDHISAQSAAQEAEGISFGETRKFTQGFLSDKPSYRTSFGKTFHGHFRANMGAYLEADECRQLLPGTSPKETISMGGLKYGVLDSEQIRFTPEQLARARQIADSVNQKIDKKGNHG